MNIVFMGTPSYATSIFEKLVHNGYTISALFTQPDKPVGRKQIITYPHIKEYCIANNLQIPIYQPEKLRDKENYTILEKIQPDVIIVAAYGQILPKEILGIAPCINLHASILPSYRGASPIQEAILHNDTFTGVTAMLMNEGLDSGEILGARYIEILDDNSSELFERLSQCAAVLTLEIVKNFCQLQALHQNKSKVSYCKKIKKEHGLIQFDNALTLYTKYRAYFPWPGVYLANGLKIIKCSLQDTMTCNTCGVILSIGSDFIQVGCNVGIVKIMEVQPESKQKMNVVDYIRGKRLKCGDCLS